MGTVKISDLPDGGALAAGDKLIIARSGNNFSIDGANVGGSDPWANYGTPDWRSDFNSSADLSPWTEISGSFAGLNYRASGGVWGNAFGRRTIANAPFVFDVRGRLSRPANGSGTGIGFFIDGDAAADRRYTLAMTSTNTSPVDGIQVQGFRRTGFSVITAPINNSITTDLSGTVADGVTFRCYYDGTNYNFFFSYANPAQVDQLFTAQVEPKSTWLGNPIAVGFSCLNGNSNQVIEFAQFQTTNLDKWAGM